jgi:hypothetical protein
MWTVLEFVSHFSATVLQIHEWHRRDGFEVGNADKIFESTSSDQIGMHASWALDIQPLVSSKVTSCSQLNTTMEGQVYFSWSSVVAVALV